jgi:hypothetical protein
VNAVAWQAVSRLTGEQICILTNPESPTFKRREADFQTEIIPLSPPPARSDVEVGDVVQINPESDDRFAACFLVVEEVKPWGFQGYVSVPGVERKVAYYRVNREDCERMGSAPWALEE